jgi:integrase
MAENLTLAGCFLKDSEGADYPPAKQPAEAAAVVIHRGVTVRIYGPLPDRQKPVWLLAYYAGSQRKKQTVKGTLEDAKKQAKQVAAGITAGDLIDALHLTPLDRRVYLTAKEAAAKTGRAVDVLCREAAEACELLGAGVTLIEAARFYRTHHSGELPAATPAQVVAELFTWLAGKRRAGVTVRTLRSIYDRFSADFATPIAHISTEDLDRWLSAHLAHSPRTQRNYRAALVRLFNFAKGKYLPRETATAAERLAVPSDDNATRGPVEIFRPWEMERLIQLAPLDLLPAIALGAFAGARTIELARLEWSALHLADPEHPSPTFPHGFLEISATVAKRHRTAQRRIVPLQPNLAAILEPYRCRTGPVSPYRRDADLSEAITAVIEAINRRDKKAHRPLLSRPKNGLRHSYASYRLPVLGNAAALAVEMNNSVAEINACYRELVYPRDVETWWQIVRTAPAKVIQLELLG